MPSAVRSALIGLSLTFLAVGMYHRIRAAHSGDRLDHTREGWPTLIALKLAGFMTFGSTAAWLWNPLWFAWAAFPVADSVRWMGGGSVRSQHHMANMDVHLPRSESHRHCHDPPERAVRRSRSLPLRGNPMYSGILMIGRKPRPRPRHLAIAACCGSDVCNPREAHAPRGNVPDRALRRSVPHLHDRVGRVLPRLN